MSQPKARLDTLLAYAAIAGREELASRIKSLLKQAKLHCGHAGETVGIVDQLRSRLAAARLAVKADDGFAAARLIMEAEQLASTFNAIRSKPLVTAALGSAGGREKTLVAIAEKRTEKCSERDTELERLDAADAKDRRYKNQKSKSSRAERIKPLYAAWANANHAKALSVNTIRKLLPDRK